MKADFTRLTFDPKKHYSRVLFQQGRVTLDADPNEQTEILLHYLRTLASDLIGPHAGPADALAFALSLEDGRLRIGAGRYYVDGILVEVNQDCDYDAQPYLAVAGDDPLAGELGSRLAGRSFRLYVDVWEHHVSSIADLLIRETALNGPDTAARSRVVWQLRAVEIGEDETGEGDTAGLCSLDGLGLAALGAGRLAACVDPDREEESPCVLSPEARYRGAENQLYRVEIHQGGPRGQATFKWSRDNGSIATRWLGKEGSELVVSSTRGFTPGCWLELTHEAAELAGTPGPLVRLVKVEGDRLGIDETAYADSAVLEWSETLRHATVRRWDQVEKGDVVLQQGAVPVSESSATDAGWIDLEDGVQVRFEDSQGGNYRSGDYWLIPARVATGSVEWPAADDGSPSWQPPRGIEHHYAPVGVVGWQGEEMSVQDCRCRLRPLRDCGARVQPLPRERVEPAPVRTVGRDVAPVRRPRRRNPDT